MCRSGIVWLAGEVASILCSISQSNPKGAAHACSGNSFRGGVSRGFTRRPKGQSTVEYVLVIAIIVLVVLIVGPWVSSAIRNQFNLVAGAIGSGTTGENFYEPEDIPDPENGTAFAVYSEDNHSLMFYKRRGVPQVGDMFNYRRVTEVYAGIEKDCYTPIDYNDSNGATNAPWYGRSGDCKSVSVVDGGIKPISIAFWFQHLKNCISFDVSKLDTSSVSGIEHIFYNCGNVRDLDLSTWDLSHCVSAVSAFAYCRNLESIELGPISTADFESCGCYWMFTECNNLSLDCSEWIIDPSAANYAFNYRAPGVIIPKAWR